MIEAVDCGQSAGYAHLPTKTGTSTSPVELRPVERGMDEIWIAGKDLGTRDKAPPEDSPAILIEPSLGDGAVGLAGEQTKVAEEEIAVGRT